LFFVIPNLFAEGIGQKQPSVTRWRMGRQQGLSPL